MNTPMGVLTPTHREHYACVSITRRHFLSYIQMPPTERATLWSVTINNPTAVDEEHIALARQKGWRVEGQLERGKEGTPHYQLMLKTPQVRFSAVKKQFPRAHIEVARNAAALEQYVAKEETREGSLPVENDRYPSLAKLWALFSDWIIMRDENTLKETWKPNMWLQRFDQFAEDAILEGYVVETMAVNPQIRAIVKQFGRAVVIRAQNIRRQTDRQTDEENFSVEGIHNGLDEEETSSEAQEADQTSSGTSVPSNEA